jgi:large subunit ribosomal protein L18e
MAKNTGTTNVHLEQLIHDLKKGSSEQGNGIWKRIAKDLSKPTRNRRVVNVSRISRATKPEETIVVPGKVLGTGAVGHPVTVAAFGFSETAKQRILEAKGQVITIKELMEKNPKGENVRIIG